MTRDSIPSLQSEIRELEAQHHFAGPLYRRLVALRVNELKREVRMEKKYRSLVVQMATLLLDNGTDLADEARCMMALQNAGYKPADIIMFLDQGIEEARIRRAAWATTKDVA